MNKIGKNVEKGTVGIVVIGLVELAAELLPIPEETKPYFVASVSGIVFSIINAIKHRRG